VAVLAKSLAATIPSKMVAPLYSLMLVAVLAKSLASLAAGDRGILVWQIPMENISRIPSWRYVA
jgi:hypothetical protein